MFINLKTKDKPSIDVSIYKARDALSFNFPFSKTNYELFISLPVGNITMDCFIVCTLSRSSSDRNRSASPARSRSSSTLA